jgi:hypothetical protein
MGVIGLKEKALGSLDKKHYLYFKLNLQKASIELILRIQIRLHRYLLKKGE